MRRNAAADDTLHRQQTIDAAALFGRLMIDDTCCCQTAGRNRLNECFSERCTPIDLFITAAVAV
jgi:hypothetical protein